SPSRSTVSLRLSIPSSGIRYAGDTRTDRCRTYLSRLLSSSIPCPSSSSLAATHTGANLDDVIPLPVLPRISMSNKRSVSPSCGVTRDDSSSYLLSIIPE
ncbi:hypothetical protein PENTCL1PPCAC_23751, partial [Pristionchus entomophagus]